MLKKQLQCFLFLRELPLKHSIEPVPRPSLHEAAKAEIPYAVV